MLDGPSQRFHVDVTPNGELNPEEPYKPVARVAGRILPANISELAPPEIIRPTMTHKMLLPRPIPERWPRLMLLEANKRPSKSSSAIPTDQGHLGPITRTESRLKWSKITQELCAMRSPPCSNTVPQNGRY